MFKEIYRTISKYDNIIIARHIGADPDAMASVSALKDSILLTFPKKNVKVTGSVTSRFSYFGKVDRVDVTEIPDNTLLIVTDTPDVKRIDTIGDINKYKAIIKIDHHPFVEKYADIEYIDDTASSASQIVLELINNTRLLMDKKIVEKIFWGIVSDTNRFMFNNSTPKTFQLVGDLIKKYDLDINKLYAPLYSHPLSEVRLEGYIGLNMELTSNGVGYIKITDDILQKYKVDAASPGNMISNFNYVDSMYVWIFITEDVKNDNYRISIRSRGPIINKIAEKYNGGGHKFASGAKISEVDDIDKLINDLDKVCEKYITEKGIDKNEN